MKKVLLLLLLMIHGVTNAQEHELLVSEIENSGCISYARGSEASNLPTIILKKDGTDLLVELQHYTSNCGTRSFDVSAHSENGWSGASYSDSIVVSVSPVIPNSQDCTCPFNVSFRLHGIEGNKFYLNCWWFDGLVELSDSEPLSLEDNTKTVLVDGFRYLLRQNYQQAILMRYNNNSRGELRIPQEVSYEDVNYCVNGYSYEAFMGNKYAKKMVIPPTIKVLSYGLNGNMYINAFQSCTCLDTIEVEPGNAVVQSVDGVMFDKKMTALLAYPAGSTRQSYEVPEGIVTLENFAFANSKQLKSVSLPSGLKSIDAQAFSGCTSLKKLDIPESVNRIEVYAFNGTKLDELYIRGVIDSSYITKPSNPYEPTMFSGMNTSTKLYVLPSEVDKFKAIYSGPVFQLPSPDEIEDIESTSNQTEKKGVAYDLQGRPIEKHASGVYIQNRKKVLVKPGEEPCDE